MEEPTNRKQSILNVTWSQAGLIVFLGMAGFFLWTEHRAHLLGALPYMIFLACPLMHIFMHRGHGKNGDNHGSHEQ